MRAELQRSKNSEFQYTYTKAGSRADFRKELEQIYLKRYKLNYEEAGFRKGEVPFKVAFKNEKLANAILQAVALVDRHLFVEEIIKDSAQLGSIYNILDGEDQTDFGGFDVESDDPVILQLVVVLASFVDKVNYEEISIDPEIIKTKPITGKDVTDLFKEYKKVKDQQNKATKTSYVELVFKDGKDEEQLVFNLNQKFDEDYDDLKKQTHGEIYEEVIGQKVGYEFDYKIKGKDGKELPVVATITDIYRIKTLSDEGFIEMLKEGSTVPEEEKEGLDIAKVKSMFKDHLEKVYIENYEEEVHSLTFAALNDCTEGIHYNEEEIDNLKDQFVIQVQKMAEQEGQTLADYIVANFGSHELMDDYVDASQRARVIQAAIYRNIGKQLNVKPTHMELQAFVKTFLFKIEPNQGIDEGLADQIDQQVEQVLNEPLNRQRVIESWASLKAEDYINKKIGLID